MHDVSDIGYGFRPNRSYVFRISISTGAIEVLMSRRFLPVNKLHLLTFVLWNDCCEGTWKSMVYTLNSSFLEDYFYKLYSRIGLP